MFLRVYERGLPRSETLNLYKNIQASVFRLNPEGAGGIFDLDLNTDVLGFYTNIYTDISVYIYYPWVGGGGTS